MRSLFILLFEIIFLSSCVDSPRYGAGEIIMKVVFPNDCTIVYRVDSAYKDQDNEWLYTTKTMIEHKEK
jgi:hypothetical protein